MFKDDGRKAASGIQHFGEYFWIVHIKCLVHLVCFALVSAQPATTVAWVLALCRLSFCAICLSKVGMAWLYLALCHICTPVSVECTLLDHHPSNVRASCRHPPGFGALACLLDLASHLHKGQLWLGTGRHRFVHSAYAYSHCSSES